MKMRKTIVALLLALVMVVSSASVLAAEAGASVQSLQAGGSGVASPQAEETVWYTRVYNGILQKRLWSITYGRWLTEWIDIGPIITP